MAKKSKRLSKNRLLKSSKLNTKRLGNKKRTKQRKPWKKRTMKGGSAARLRANAGDFLRNINPEDGIRIKSYLKESIHKL